MISTKFGQPVISGTLVSMAYIKKLYLVVTSKAWKRTACTYWFKCKWTKVVHPITKQRRKQCKMLRTKRSCTSQSWTKPLDHCYAMNIFEGRGHADGAWGEIQRDPKKPGCSPKCQPGGFCEKSGMNYKCMKPGMFATNNMVMYDPKEGVKFGCS